MKLFYQHISIFLLIVIVTSGCVKDIDSFTSNGPGAIFQGDVNKMYSDIRKAIPQITTIAPSNSQTKINIDDSSYLIIPANAWVDKNSKQIKGDVTVFIRLISTKADKVRFAQYSNLGGRTYQWLNNIEILATSEGNSVSLGQGKLIELFAQNDKLYSNLNVYHGSYESTRKFQVSLASSDTIIQTSWTNAFGTIINGYKSSLSKTGWSCNGFEIPNSTMSQAAVTLPTEMRDFNTLVALTSESSDLVINMQPSNPYSSTFKGSIDVIENLRLLCLVDQNQGNRLGVLDYFLQLPSELSKTQPVSVTEVAFEELLNGF